MAEKFDPDFNRKSFLPGASWEHVAQARGGSRQEMT